MSFNDFCLNIYLYMYTCTYNKLSCSTVHIYFIYYKHLYIFLYSITKKSPNSVIRLATKVEVWRRFEMSPNKLLRYCIVGKINFVLPYCWLNKVLRCCTAFFYINCVSFFISFFFVRFLFKVIQFTAIRLYCIVFMFCVAVLLALQ